MSYWDHVFVAGKYSHFPPRNEIEVVKLFFLHRRKIFKDYHPKDQLYYERCQEFLNSDTFDLENRVGLIQRIQSLTGGRFPTISKGLEYWIDCWKTGKWCSYCHKKPIAKNMRKLCACCFTKGRKLVLLDEPSCGRGTAVRGTINAVRKI